MIVTGRYNKINPDKSIVGFEDYKIDIEIDDRVVFVDNSILEQCRNNTDGEKIYWMYAGCLANDYATNYGTIARINSCQTAEGEHVIYPYQREIEMPIVVICDNGDVVYCNPLNIQVIDK